jgi:hypothetical protein
VRREQRDKGLIKGIDDQEKRETEKEIKLRSEISRSFLLLGGGTATCGRL